MLTLVFDMEYLEWSLFNQQEFESANEHNLKYYDNNQTLSFTSQLVDACVCRTICE